MEEKEIQELKKHFDAISKILEPYGYSDDAIELLEETIRFNKKMQHLNEQGRKCADDLRVKQLKFEGKIKELIKP